LTSTPELLRKRVRLDLEYIRMWTLWLDVVIILKTVRQVIMPPSSAH
jgi:lipopolysaccharide/colanic/teichoic acid biosynthesis glycosyltransferase